MAEFDFITSMTADPKAPDLRRIRVGKRRIATIRRQDVDTLGLSVGDPLTQTLLDTLDRLDRLAALRLRAIRSLSRAAASRRRLESRLYRHGEPADIAEVLDQLIVDGILDEHATARQIAGEAMRREPVGRRKLEAMLRSRGFEREATDEAVAQAQCDRDPLEDAMEAGRRAARGLSHLPRETAV
jgi:SOS response regulatory protein OraA/RecX